MKLTNYIFIIFSFSTFHFAFSQEQLRSKKEIQKVINESGDAFYKLDVEKSLNLAKLALKDARVINDNELMAKAYNIIGLNFEEFYDVKKSIDFYKKALYHSKLTNNDSIKDWVNNNLGNVYTYRNIDFKTGIGYYKQGLIYAKKINDPVEILYTQLNISGAYFSVEDFKNGIVYLEEAKPAILQSNELEAKISMNSQYGSYYSFLNENDKAEKYYSNAIELAKTNKSQLIDATIVEVYNDYSKHLKKINDYKNALYYLTLYRDLKEKIYNVERTNKVKIAGGEIEANEYRRQIGKIEIEKHKQSKDLKESKLIVLLFVIIFLILLLLIYSLYKNNTFRELSNNDLKIANEELKIAKEKAEVASQLKTQFVSTISHELRTPLYGVVGITNIIIDEHKELANSPHLNSLKFSARYLLSLVNDLLQINKIEENKITLENMIFNLSDEITTIVESLEFIAIKNNNKLIAEIDTDIPEYLIGDKLRLSQVFMNLVSNALKFTKDGEVTISAHQKMIEGTKHYISFEVKDTGIGIAEADQDKIFEKFVQIERKEGDYQGTGLGLSIVQKLIELFDSTIELESKEKVGTTFSFTIGFESDESKKNEIIENIEVDLSENNLHKVLVVEDNKINQVVTRKILENNNFKCTILEDGYAAITLLESEHFDIILMDINMPIINGFETSKLIRKKGIKTPIIALTAFDKQEVTEEALAAGMNDVIVKPFESIKLFQIINSLIIKKNAD